MDEVNHIVKEESNRHDRLLRTSRRFYRMNRRDVSFLRFILEAYDGVAVLTTQDAPRGVVSVSIAPGCENLVDGIIRSLCVEEDMMIEPLTPEDRATCFQGKTCLSSI
jgi:hypothetical protein